METRQEVKTIQVDYKCPKCNTGYLRPTGIVLCTYPPQYPHKCNNPKCDYGQTFPDARYPYLEYESSTPVIDVKIDPEKIINVEPVLIREDHEN